MTFEPLTEKNTPKECSRHPGSTFTDEARGGSEDQVVRTYSCGDVALYRFSTPYVLVRPRGRSLFEYLTTGLGEKPAWSTNPHEAIGFETKDAARERANEVSGRMQCLNLRLAMHLNDPNKVSA